MPLKYNENYRIEYIPYHRNQKEKRLKIKYFNAIFVHVLVATAFLMLRLFSHDHLFLTINSETTNFMWNLIFVQNCICALNFLYHIFTIMQIIYEKNRFLTFGIFISPIFMAFETCIQMTHYASNFFISDSALPLTFYVMLILTTIMYFTTLRFMQYPLKTYKIFKSLNRYEKYLNTKPKRPRNETKPITMDRIIKLKNKQYFWYRRFYCRKIFAL